VSKAKKQYVYLLLDCDNQIEDVSMTRQVLKNQLDIWKDYHGNNYFRGFKIIKAEVQIGESNSKK
jgi:hypothetical protein